MYKVLLFDLDGTLTASGEGITKSVQYALEKLGRKKESLEELKVFIGPPLLEQFVKHCGMTEEEAERGVQFYRERYNTIGYRENYPYDGIKELLDDLKDKGFILAVSSSKPDGMVKKILEHFGLTGYFAEIVGSDPEKMKMSKADVILLTLERLGYLDKKKCAVMIGDRKQDAIGAKKVGVDCIGVLYGYGSYEELKDAGAGHIVETVGELGKYLKKGEV